MHCHRDQDRTAPFVGNRETTSQDEQGHKRGEMCVRCGKQQRAECDAQKTAEITLEYTVNKKSKKKLLNHRGDRYRENNDHHPLLDRARSAEKLDDVLLARAAPEKPLRNGIRQQDQWIRKKQQDRSGAQGPGKTYSEKPAQRADVESAKMKECHYEEHDESGEKEISQKIARAELDRGLRNCCADIQQKKKNQQR